MQWLNDVFGVPKPIIAMLHLGALPGDPAYDTASGMRKIVDDARRDLDALQTGGVDAVLISNEFSLPYLTKTEPITAITMARVIGELLDEITVPFGANVLWDGVASIDLAAATGAAFVREIFTGVYASDFGLWDTNVGYSARHRRRVDAGNVRLLFNVVPEATSYVAQRDLASITRSTVFNAKPDALVVSGLTAGAPTDSSALSTVKQNAGEVPVFVNTGMRAETAEQQLAIADGAVVGTALKKDGKFENHPDVNRVTELMAVVKDYRSSLPASAVG
ncbi:sgc region protein SgcQ [Mycolicibacterium helvum]|uniref:Sgc region protein SgcQ n=2 Tax=Mycolicibacterium helvum TaxID=1534349 RepID=A0A7I7TD43_9MYCO|nr:sgc region protein SgcQ [Mycolicibacterium helvum]